jgi:hypothetical protein
MRDPSPRSHARTSPHARAGSRPNVKTSSVAVGRGFRNFHGLYIYPRQTAGGWNEGTAKLPHLFLCCCNQEADWFKALNA